MSASRIKKENIILLPNRDKLYIGKVKEVNKFLNMVSAEYNIEEDMGYFNIIKEKSENLFHLQFIPREVSELHSINAKKFVLYELIRIGRDCVIKTDDELYKRALVIDDLLNKIEDSCKETITSKLNAMFEIPGELDCLVDQLLTDPQFNSFKYPVLDEKKMTLLLCVNGDGLFMRSMEAPFNITKQLSWKDIDSIKVKKHKMIFHKVNGETEEVTWSHKKTINSGHEHLMRYLVFVGNRESNDTKRSKGNWFDTFALKVRKSFRKRSRSQDAAKDVSVHSTLTKSLSRPPNQIVPLHSASVAVASNPVCEDSVGLRRTPVETSRDANTLIHNTSVGSGSSFGNCPSSYGQPASSLTLQSGQDDHMSVKTTSTYEVSFESGPSQRTLSDGSRGDSDSLGPNLTSFSLSQPSRSPPVSQTTSDSVVLNKGESVKHATKIVAVPPPMVPTRMCQAQEPFQPQFQYPQFDAVKLPPPPPPVRSQNIEIHESVTSLNIPPPPPVRSQDMEIHDSVSPRPPVRSQDMEIHESVSPPPPVRSQDVEIHESVTSSYISPPQMVPEVECTQVLVDESKTIDTSDMIDPVDSEETVAKGDYCDNIVSEATHIVNIAPEDQYCTGMDNEDHEEAILTTEVSQMDYGRQGDQSGNIIPHTTEHVPHSPIEADVVDNEAGKIVNVECKLPVYQRKSIPCPKIQRPSRIPSSPRDPASSPTTPSNLALKAPSPSDKENYNGSSVKDEHSVDTHHSPDNHPHSQRIGSITQYDHDHHKIDSKTTVTTTTTSTGDRATSKSPKSEVSSTVKTSGIPAPRQYKTTTPTAATVKKPSEPPKSPVIGVQRVSGIPRMSMK